MSLAPLKQHTQLPWHLYLFCSILCRMQVSEIMRNVIKHPISNSTQKFLFNLVSFRQGQMSSRRALLWIITGLFSTYGHMKRYTFPRNIYHKRYRHRIFILQNTQLRPYNYLKNFKILFQEESLQKIMGHQTSKHAQQYIQLH